VRAGEPLVKLADRQLTGRDRASDIRKPVAVLVNAETRAAAEALAAILRESAAALVIGSKTAGEARLYETFTLSTGQKLRVGKVPVVVGRDKAIPATGIVPDIKVDVKAEEERAYYQDPFRQRQMFAAAGSTNENSPLIQGRPTSEAELVRRHRNGGEEIEPVTPLRREPPEVAVVTDPTLARALDFLKGISIWQPRR
jgi:C-terminal processing protease CtpA/Prc